MNATVPNLDPREVLKFDALAARWWDPQGECKPLHDINPLRVQYVEARASVRGKRLLDIGCGGGIYAEGLARLGSDVTAIDASAHALQVAKLHLLESGLRVDYRARTAEQLADEQPGHYDIVTCMEMLEHVPDPCSVVEACARLVKPGGHVFFSTINRTPKAYLLAVLGAEYVLRLLPRGTHDYARFIRPSELAMCIRRAGLTLHGMAGMSYNPLTQHSALVDDIDVNYFAHCTRAA